MAGRNTQHEQHSRGQTEPLAALVAIAAFCAAFSMYTGVHASLLSDQGSDRALGEPTTDRIWNDISDDGVFYRDSLDIDSTTLPTGYYVAVTVTTVGDEGRIKSVDRTTYDPDGKPLDANPEPPDGADRYQRRISIQHGPGDVRPGSLVVVVWE